MEERGAVGGVRSVGTVWPRAHGTGFIALLAIAAAGGALLLVIAVDRWTGLSDEHAYWLAGHNLLTGQPVYTPGAGGATPYAFWYPPVVAQVMAVVAGIVPSPLFSVLWTVLLLICLLWLARGRPLVALALIAFVPVAAELWFRNVHLVLALLLVLSLRRSPWLFAVGAAIKIAPGLGLVYLVAAKRWHDAALTVAVGLVLASISFLISPHLWRQYMDVLADRGLGDTASLIPVAYGARALASVAVAAAAGRLGGRVGEVLLVVAVILGSPTLWATTLSLLAALVPLLGSPGTGIGESAMPRDRDDL